MAIAENFAVGPRVGERVLAMVCWGVRLFKRHHLRRRGCPLQAVVPRAGGITQGILEAQEVVDGVGVALRHAHELRCGLTPLGGLAQLPNIDARGVA